MTDEQHWREHIQTGRFIVNRKCKRCVKAWNQAHPPRRPFQIETYPLNEFTRIAAVKMVPR